MGWLTGERKAIGMPINDGTQGTLSLPAFGSGGARMDGALYPDAAYSSYATNGYGRNELVYACIFERAEALPQSQLRVYARGGGGDPLELHRLRRLIAEPNPVTTEYQFWELSSTYLDLAGNCIWLVARGNDGLPSELWPLRPDLVRILPTRDPRVWSYGYVMDPSNAQTGTTAEIIPIPRGDVIHVKYPNPLDPYFGQPPLRAASRAVSLDNAATDFVDTLLRNYAVPGAVIEVVDEIDQTIADKLKRRWRESFTGSHRGDVVVLQKGMSVKSLGMSLRDLEFPDLRGVTESRICMAFKVPPILVGAKVGLDRSTFANYKEARASLWEESIMPLQRRFGDAISTKLLPEFAGAGRAAVETRWDNSDVLALREGERDRWERATNALARGGITLNDFRRTIDLDPVPAGDVFMVPAGVTLQPADHLGEPMAPDAADQTATDQTDQPATDQPAPMMQAASYAEHFLSRLRDETPALNGHHR